MANENRTTKENKNATGNTLAGAGTGAATGATIGSLVGPYGTAIGAGVGAIVGGVAGYFSGQKEVTRNAKSLRIGPGNISAGYSNEELNKDYGFDNIVIGGEATSLAKAGQITNLTLGAAGQVAGGIKGMKSNNTMGMESQPIQNQNADQTLATNPNQINNSLQYQTDINQQYSPIGQKPYVGKEIQTNEKDFWKQQYQNQNQTLYTNPYKQ